MGRRRGWSGAGPGPDPFSVCLTRGGGGGSGPVLFPPVSGQTAVMVSMTVTVMVAG